MTPNHARRHFCVGKNSIARQTVALFFARLHHSLPDGCRIISLRGRVSAEVAKLNRRDVDVDINAIQKRSGNAADVALYLQRRAATFASRVVPKSARAGVHCGGQHERSGESKRHRGAADGHLLIFKRLTQDFQNTTIKLRQLIEDHHAMVSEETLARPRPRAPANQPGVANRVVRRSKWAFGYQTGAAG